MRRVAFLTLADPTRYEIDESHGIAALAERGIAVNEVPWSHRDHDWNAFDGVIIRTTWDYHEHPTEFLTALAGLTSQGVRLANSEALVRWNLDKRYLQELASAGIPIVPSIWAHGGTPADFEAMAGQIDSREIIVKPTVSANAMDTFRLPNPISSRQSKQLAETFAERHWFAQPFLDAVLTEGEYSIYYFGGNLSHAIRKVPQAGDFRVQENHGGDIQPCEISPELERVASQVMAALPETPLQARVDLIRLADGDLGLIELELIEPALYLNTNVDAAGIFADAVVAWLETGLPPTNN